MSNKVPLLLFAFANERQKDTQYLRALTDERRAIEAALAPAERAGLCEVKMLPNATLGEIFGAFQDERYRDRVAIFHYGGHANSATLLLERNDGENEAAHREGLIPLLRNQKALQLVFLNGCSTEKWALSLNEAGIPLVAGTFEAILDKVAQQLAAQFYAGVGQGMPLSRAWNEAIYKVKAPGDGTPRGFGRADLVLDRFPWELFQRRGADIVREWNLPEVNQNPLAMLPLPEKYAEMPLPNEPFRFLDRYKKEDALIFFGRGRAIRDLYDRLTNPLGSPVVLLSGQSGVGKSSLLEAGLLPRLEDKCEVIYVRRDADLKLIGTLCRSLQDYLGGAIEPDQVLSSWKKIEQQKGKPLVVLLDQAEEAFTRDNGGGPQEIEELAALLQDVFGKIPEKPKGKILLGFRKEYEGEIEDVVKNNKLDYVYVFQKRLSRSDIIEVVTGLTSTPRLAQKYGLRVEDGLPETIATDLLTDSDTPVAPVLQIVLTKLWQSPDNQRYFTHEEYLRLKEDGIFLGDFFRQQMEQLRAWEKQAGKDVESSGLALDILHSHVTDLGFANSRSLDELKKAYQHRSDVLDLLMKQFKTLYLLTDSGKERTALAHDTLAPVVQQEVKNSDRPGQKALRILTGKIANYRRNADQTYIPEDDLALVEKGEAGMRMWVEEEPALIEKSRERRKKQRRQRLWGWGALLVLTGIAAWLGYTNYQQTIIEKYVANARLEAIKDPTAAMKILQKAIDKAPDNPAVLAALNEIWSNNEFYERTYTHPLPVIGVVLAPDSSKVFYSWTEQMVYKWTLDGIRKDSMPVAYIRAAALSPDGRFLVVANQSGTLMRLETADFQRNLLSVKPFGDQCAVNLVFAPKGDVFFAALINQSIHTLSIDNINTSISNFAAPDEVNCLDIHPYNKTLLVGYALGSAEEYTLDGKKIRALDKHTDRVLSFAVSPSDSVLVSSGRDGEMLFHGRNGRPTLALKGHNERIDAVRWAPDGNRLFSAAKDYLVKTWSPERNQIAVYRGHAGIIYDLSVAKDGQYFLSASEDKTVRLWKTESKVAQRYGSHEGGVTGMALIDNGKVLASVSNQGEYDGGDTGNNPGAQILDMEAQFGLRPRSLLLSDAKTGARQHTLQGHKGGINAVAFDALQQVLLTASCDSTVGVWDSNRNMTTFKAHEGDVLDIAWSARQQYRATAGEDSMAILWDRHNVPLYPIKHNDLVSRVAFAPNDDFWATGCFDGTATLLDFSGKTVATMGDPAIDHRVTSIALAPDIPLLAVGRGGNTVTFYDFKGQVTSTLTLFSENKTGGQAVHSIAISADGRYYAFGMEGGMAEVFRRIDNTFVSVLRLQHYPKRAILFLAFTADGRQLLTGSNDRFGRIWNLPIQ